MYRPFYTAKPDTRMQEWVHVWVKATNEINYLQVQKRQLIVHFAEHLFFYPDKSLIKKVPLRLS
jgi:hypothetical protein